MKQTNAPQKGWTGKTRLHLGTAAAFGSIAVFAMVGSLAIAATNTTSCAYSAKLGWALWMPQNAGKSWSCQTNGSELVLDVHAGDVWPGDVGRPQVWNRSQIVSMGPGTSGIGVRVNVPAHYSFDVMVENGPINQRQGMEFHELFGAHPSLFMQFTTVNNVEYVQIFGWGTNTNVSNYIPQPSGNKALGVGPVLTRGLWHHVDIQYLDTKGVAGGYMIITWDGATIMNYYGPTGYAADAMLEYQLGNYGIQPPAGSSDTDQIIHFKNPNFVGY